MSQAVAEAAPAPLVIGRYALFDELAAGGMATVHLGRLLGPVGFGRTVAVKRLHAHYLKDQEFITMFMDEARIVARIRHPNVVPMVDVVQSELGLFLVMEYVHGESLSRLMRTARKSGEPIPPRIVAAIMCGVLQGLHAAHDTKGPDGTLLGVVHRDVSPQNVIVGADGTARVLDFGIAKAQGRAQVTREGQIKGKLAYMAPEQIRGQVDRRTDVFAAAVVLWEMLASRRLHEGSKDVDIVTRVVRGNFPPPSQVNPAVSPELDAIVMRGLAADPKKRFDSARDLAVELERTVGLASPSEVSVWVETLAEEVLDARTSLVLAMELAAGDLVALESNPPPPSEALPMHVLPQRDEIPVDIDTSLTRRMNNEVPSSSAVFAHSHTHVGEPSDELDQAPRGAPLSIDRTAWVIFAVSIVLAVVGATLGAYALVRRSSAASARPDTLAGPSLPVAGPSLVAAAPAPAPPAPSAAPQGTTTTTPADIDLDEKPAATGDPPKPTATPLASATPTLTPSTTATWSKPVALPPPTTSKKPGKPSCEPPYTLDEIGHRHYKPECMGLD